MPRDFERLYGAVTGTAIARTSTIKGYIDVPDRGSLKGRETDRFPKTLSSRDAATKPARMHSRLVLANLSVSSLTLSPMALGLPGTRTGT